MAYLDTIAHKKIGILGLGVSGLACVSFLMKFRIKPFVMDGDLESQGVKSVKSTWPEIKIYQQLPKADLLIVSPGIANDNPWLQAAKKQGIEIIGDIELFARINHNPVIAITGSNGKSTVTTLVTQLLKNAGYHAVMGGNIGVPVLSLLSRPFDVAVLELSSFQLETTASLNCQIATILNCAEDHMDRYEGFTEYVAAKQRIFHHAACAVVNRADANSVPVTEPSRLHQAQQVSFGLDAPGSTRDCQDVGLVDEHFARGGQLICPLSDLAMVGMHNVLNALAAIALVTPFNVPDAAIAKTFAEFNGLPHRCELLSGTDQIRWVNDSKATNVGATLAAINGIGAQCQGRLILIAGGVGKGADFSPLQQPLQQAWLQLISFGRDGDKIAQLTNNAISVADLSAAVRKAHELALPGDWVLLSPACASFDMFDNFEHRGETFRQLVAEVYNVS